MFPWVERNYRKSRSDALEDDDARGEAKRRRVVLARGVAWPFIPNVSLTPAPSSGSGMLTAYLRASMRDEVPLAA